MEEPTQEEIENINLREEEIREILSTPPNWLVSWGITIVLFAFLALIAISWWVKYPDIVTAPIVLTTPNPPIPVVSRKAGNITQLLVEDNELVAQGQRLAIIKSAAKPTDIGLLEDFVATLQELKLDTLMMINYPTKLQIGELEEPYSNFVQYLENYKLYLKQQTALKQIPFLKKEINYLARLNRELIFKDSILKSSIKVAKQNYKRQKEALKIGGVVAEKVEQIEAQMLDFERQRRDINLGVLNNKIAKNDLKNKIENINQQTEEASKGQFILVRESFRQLEAALEEWCENFILTAPINGRVTFYEYWSVQQFVQLGDEVFTIVPEEKQISGKLLLPVLGSGKVAEGQKVNIKMSAFPYREYGIVEGRVEQIALVAKQNTLMVNIQLSNGLRTTYQKDLSFHQQMQGQAEIITKDRRLLERFLTSFLTGE